MSFKSFTMEVESMLPISFASSPVIVSSCVLTSFARSSSFLPVMSSYALYTPVSAAVPLTSKGAATMMRASVMPAVASALIYISPVHHVMLLVVTSMPLPSGRSSTYTQEIDLVPIRLSST